MGELQQLMQASLGVGVGITVGTAIGLGFRKRSGKTEGLIGGSVFVTAAACGALAMGAMMLFKWIGS
ncbi:hypothetical protein NBRC116601_08570 [Cognatishimia sp. WU-CL00825]|uniref:hypothetical protein n=1 Tax=Cognatishimia sp. WU-CL00825 TaxID=3127658 RepID=UPI00310822ED